MHASTARRAWQLLEPYHALIYFAPETAEAYGGAGLKGYWMGYFASRSAPMGPVGPGVVTATFFNFAPAMVHRAIPDAWSFSTPERVLAARLDVADSALRRLLGDAVNDEGIREAADIAMRAADAGDAAGRPLYAAHMNLPVPDEPHLRLWHAASCLREHRGDGHVATLLSEGLDGCEANVVAVAEGLVVRETQASRRGWSEEQWRGARQRLRDRGLVDAAGESTGAGVLARDALEARTDELALAPYEAIGAPATQRLLALLEPIVRRLIDAEAIPYPNPVGVSAPTWT